MEKEGETVTYKRSDIIDVLRDLEMLVVSTDRVGSTPYYDRESDEQYNALFVNFFDDMKFFRRLARAREVLSEPFPYEAGEDGMDELEREFQDLKFWPDVDDQDSQT